MQRSLRGSAANPAKDRRAIIAKALPVGEAAVDDNAHRHAGSERGSKRRPIEELRPRAAAHVIKIQVAARAAMRRHLPTSPAAGDPILVLAGNNPSDRRRPREIGRRRGRRLETHRAARKRGRGRGGGSSRSGNRTGRHARRRRRQGSVHRFWRQQLRAARRVRRSVFGGRSSSDSRISRANVGSGRGDQSHKAQRRHHRPHNSRSRHARCGAERTAGRFEKADACLPAADHELTSRDVGSWSKQFAWVKNDSRPVPWTNASKPSSRETAAPLIGRSSIQNCAAKRTFAGEPIMRFRGVRKI